MDDDVYYFPRILERDYPAFLRDLMQGEVQPTFAEWQQFIAKRRLEEERDHGQKAKMQR